MDRKVFFDEVRETLFNGRLMVSQVEGMEHLLNEWALFKGGGDPRHLAYIFATTYHETGRRMQPVREGFAANDARAREVVAGRKYGKPDPVTGEVYYGRGDVQLTWADNYKRMGHILGLPLYEQPDLALEPDVSKAILIEGMMQGASNRGDFTGKSVENYFNATTDDPVGARRVVNGTDKAEMIAGYHRKFLVALEAAGSVKPPETSGDIEERLSAIEARLDAIAAAAKGRL